MIVEPHELQKKKKMKMLGWAALSVLVVLVCFSLYHCSKEKKITHPVKPIVASSKPTAKIPAAPTIKVAPAKVLEKVPATAETIVDLYYGGQAIGEAYVQLTDTTVKFLDPQSVVEKLPNLKDKAEVLRALTGPLAMNSDLVCQNSQQIKTTCGVLTPKIAGVIYNPSNFRTDIFIAPEYLTTLTINGLLPNSDSGFSYLNQLSAVAAGTRTGGTSTDNYNLVANNTVAYQNARFNADVNYSNSQTNQNQEQLNVSRLNAVYNFDDKEVQAGIINSHGNTFVASQNILGAMFSTTLDTVKDDSVNYGSLLQIFLPTPSTVNIYRDGTLLSSQRYPMGNQILNTTALPSGAYQVTIETIDDQGNRTRTTRFFAKTNQVPPKKYPQYYIDTGYLQENQFVNNRVLPGFRNEALYQAGMSMRVFTPLGVSADVTGADGYNFLTLGTYFIGDGFQIGPQAMLGSHDTQGAGLQAQSNIGSLQSTLFLRQVWSNENNVPQTVVVDNNSVNNLASIEQTSTQLSFNMSYQLAKASLGFVSNLTRLQDSPDIYSYGPTLRVPLYSRGNTALDFSLTATKTQNDLQVLGQFTFYMMAKHWANTASAGYRNISQTDNTNQRSTGIGDVSSTWRHLDEAQQGIQLGVRGHAERDNNSVGASADYVNNLVGANASVTQAFANNGSSAGTQYSVNAESHFAYTPKQSSIGGGRNGDTGVIVYIASKHPGDKFEVYVNDQVEKVVESDEATPIFLAPFNTYQIRIRDISKRFYEYKQSPQTVTLYRGNIHPLTWKARTKTVLYGRLLQPNGKPLKIGLISGGVGPALTDADGDFQLEVYDDTQQLTSKLTNGRVCTILIPKLGENPGYVDVNNLTCRSKT